VEFEIGQIVSYSAGPYPATDETKWLFFIIDVLPIRGPRGRIYKVFCFKTPKGQIDNRDLFVTKQFSAASINAVCTDSERLGGYINK
jgi:hypothetical protein